MGRDTSSHNVVPHPNNPYANPRWRALRLQVAEEQDWRCGKCCVPIWPGSGWEADHIVRLADGGAMWDRGNIMALCRRCHFKKTGQENRRPPTEAEQRWAELVNEL